MGGCAPGTHAMLSAIFDHVCWIGKQFKGGSAAETHPAADQGPESQRISETGRYFFMPSQWMSNEAKRTKNITFFIRSETIPETVPASRQSWWFS